MKRLTAVCTVLALLLGAVSFYVSAKDGPGAISADSAILMDQTSGKVLFEKDAHHKMYPASVTKIMSLLLFVEAIEDGKLKLTDKVEATLEAVEKGGSQIWLKEGETMTVDELLRATAIGSANDACTALAVWISGSEAAFVKQMNQRAAALGMRDTHFENCTGLDDDCKNHLTTAYDIALMSRALLQHDMVRTYTKVWMDSLRDGKTQLVNTNKLVRFYEGTTGLKTGTTSKAGCCISASAERNGLHLIAVVLHAKTGDDRFSDAKAMLDWGFATFESVTPHVDQTLLQPVAVRHGITDQVTVEPAELQPLLLKTGEKEKLKTEVTLPEDLFAPVEKGQIVGELAIYLGKEKLASYPLYAKEAVRKLTLGDVLLQMLDALRVRN